MKAVADVRTNAVIVAASERNFEMIDDLVRSLDRQISDMLIVKVYELQNADADGMAKILQDIFRPQVNATRSAGRTQQGGGGGRGSRFMQMMGNSGNSGTSLSPNDEIEITSDERTNAVIVKASPEYIKIMDEVVDRLDHNPTESTSTYVLPLRFADAPDIAEVIRDLLQGSRSSSSRTTGNSNSGSTRNSGTFVLDSFPCSSSEEIAIDNKERISFNMGDRSQQRLEKRTGSAYRRPATSVRPRIVTFAETRQ